MLQTPFNNIETEKSNRYCKLHVQTWIYIHCAVSILISITGITIGITLLVNSDWHEKFQLYKQILAYLRRRDPVLYWMCYKICLISWISLHFAHLITVISTIIGIQLTNSRLVALQIMVLVFQVGVYITGIFGLVVISVTGTRITWIALTIVSFFFFFASLVSLPLQYSNLFFVVAYHRFLDEKNAALRAILANTKSVHFKERLDI